MPSREPRPGFRPPPPPAALRAGRGPLPRRGTWGPAFPRGLGSGRPATALRARAREREVGGRRGTGAAALCSLPRPFPGLRPPAVRRGAVGAGAGAAVPGGRRGWLLGATSGAFLPLGWRGLVTQVDRGRRGGRRNMARCPPSCKLGGGSLRRRAQSPFVRRNKERHCVPPTPSAVLCPVEGARFFFTCGGGDRR